MENTIEIPQKKKIKIEFPDDPAIPLLIISLGKMKALTLNNICTSMFIATLFAISQDMETAAMSTNR